MIPAATDNEWNSKLIAISALMFLFFDTAALGLSYWIARQIESDAIAINLAGRQRMLSQRMTKTILQYEQAINAGEQPGEALRSELETSANLFDETIHAFALGGEVEAADGRPVFQMPLDNEEGQQLVRLAQDEWQPLSRATRVLLKANNADSITRVSEAVVIASHSNLPLLDYSNRITNHIETASRQRTRDLRNLQVLAFCLALLNFFVLARSLWLRLHLLHGSHERMREQAETDALTGLPNRQALLTRLENAIAEVDKRHTRLVVGFLDLNGFKPVNDHYGHAAGDQILKQIASRLQLCLRQSDMIARHGGDEFVIILENTGSDDQVCQLLDNLIAALQAPVRIVADTDIEIGVSIGAVVIDSSKTAPDILIHLADKLMYRTKHASDSDWMLAKLVPGRNELLDIAEQASWADSIKQA